MSSHKVLPNATYRPQFDDGHEVVAHPAGQMRKIRVPVLARDEVQVEMTSS